tara:strand:- start:345 stop:527 length:183 start_codon:yes stop_codon:yes gene_type:complete
MSKSKEVLIIRYHSGRTIAYILDSIEDYREALITLIEGGIDMIMEVELAELQNKKEEKSK